jgi:hypothetical protein
LKQVLGNAVTVQVGPCTQISHQLSPQKRLVQMAWFKSAANDRRAASKVEGGRR